jgi:hypothetical protein
MCDMQHSMPVKGGVRNSCAIRATSIEDPNVTIDYPSLLAAKKELQTRFGEDIHHHTIKRWAQNEREAHGFKWELANKEEDDDTTDEEVEPFENVFTFRECVEAIFNGGKVRVTNENPRVPWDRLCRANAEIVTRCYNFSFPGSRGGATPVIDASGVLHIVNGSVKTELFTGFSIEEGEQCLMRLCEERQLQDANELRKAQMQLAHKERQLAHEEKRMEYEVEMKRLELQITQA